MSMDHITFGQAKERGLARYFTGAPCRNGHVAERFVANRTCCACNAAKRESWGRANPEKATDATRRWKQRNPEATKAIEARKYAKNGHKIRERVAAWRSNNAEKARNATAAWVAANRWRVRATQAKRRARKLQATPPWLTDAYFEEMAAIYAEANRLTRRTGIPHHVDHIVPLQGENVCGLHVPWNLVPMPAADNIGKSNVFDTGATALQRMTERRRGGNSRAA